MKKAISLLLLSLCLSVLHARDINFSQISSKNGLSQNTVRAIAEDKNGFIWAGTLDGLNRYDGYNIRSYQLRTGDQHILHDHRIRNLYATRDGNLWVQTYQQEYSCYNPISDQFVHIRDKNGKLLAHENFYESSGGDVWLWGKGTGTIRLHKKEDGNFDQQSYLQAEDACNFLLEDSSGKIWIGGKNGLKSISEQGEVKEFYTYEYYFTHAIEVEGMIYFSTMESELLIYDMKRGIFEEVTPAFNDAMTHLFRLSSHELLVFFDSKGVWIYDISYGTFHQSGLNCEKEHLTSDVEIIYDKKKGVWFYSKSGRLWYCNGEDSRIRRINIDLNKDLAMMGTGQTALSIDAVLAGSDGLYWIVTYGFGLFCYNPVDETLVNYTNQPDPSSLASNYLLSITEDRLGNIWIGSEYAGIIRVVKSPEYVHVVHPEAGTIIGKTNNVRSIYEDSKENIWVGLKNGELYVYDSAMNLKKHIDWVINPYALVEDNQRRMWVGTKGYGIYLFDIENYNELAHLTHKKNKPESLCSDAVFHILKDNKNRIWVASFENGGIGLAQETKEGITFKNFITGKGNKSMIRYLYQDNKERIWGGTSDGLVRFNPGELIRNPDAYVFYNMDLTSPYSLSSNDIKTIYQDTNGDIWIGTAGGGLDKYIEAREGTSDQFLSFTIGEGMPDNYVLGILEHGDYLWLSSENGLSRFCKNDYSVISYQFAQKAYANIFNEGARFKCKNGIMLWGTLDGLMIFDPEKFEPNTNPFPVLVTSLQIDGVDWNEVESSVEKKSITYTEEIQLTYEQNVFTVEFATLDLQNPEQNQYTYILENYDKSWSIPASLNTVTYKNLPPGKYTFKVKGANSYGIWNDEVTSLKITITPPFWKSNMAYTVYVSLFIFILFVFYRLIAKFNRLNNAVEIEKQLTNHKLRFFTNISHEFRTPLTLIQGAVERLNELGDLPVPAYKQLSVLNRNSMNLRRLIDQLLEFRKLQNDVLKLDLEEIDMVSFTQDIYGGFQEIAVQKNINYQFDCSMESLILFIDRKKIDKVLYNLLSNAFKFTPKGGCIILSLAEDEKRRKCILSVKDSGIGIPKEKQHLLFSRFSQIHFSKSGTGVGLSLVKEFVDVHKGKIYFEDNPSGGAIFKVELSTSKETYVGENFVTVRPHMDIIEDSPVVKSVQVEQEKVFPSVESNILAEYRLLVIDDNDDIRDFLMDGFSGSMIVDTAADGKEGLQKAIDTNPDIIICDVMMPEMNGFEVTRQLKKDFQTCHIPIILLTAHSSLEHELEGIDSGADAYITKSFSLKYVQKRVMKLVEQRELLKKLFSKEFTIDERVTNTTDKEFFDKIEKILDDNYEDSTFTIDRFIELSGIRRTIFFKKVKGITGFSPNELIKMKRLNKAAVLLRQGEFTVSEVSYKVGFEDPFYFSKCFKAHFDCTPKNYKKSI